MESACGNQSEAARILRIVQDALRYKLKKYNLKTESAARRAVMAAPNWQDACFIDSVKHCMRVIDLAVVTLLSLLIVAALVHAGGQVRAAGGETQPLTVQSGR